VCVPGVYIGCGTGCVHSGDTYQGGIYRVVYREAYPPGRHTWLYTTRVYTTVVHPAIHHPGMYHRCTPLACLPTYGVHTGIYREAERPLGTLRTYREAERPLGTLRMRGKEAERPPRTLRKRGKEAERPPRTLEESKRGRKTSQDLREEE